MRIERRTALRAPTTIPGGIFEHMPGNTSIPTTVPQPAGAARAKRSATARRAALLAVALAAAASIAACGSSSSSNSTSGSASGEVAGKRLDTARIQRSIELSILSEKHIHAAVTCPTEEQRQGNVFTCYASGTLTRNGKTEAFRTPFTVEEVNARGYVYYHS
jgi:hypothetical protein